MAKYSHSAIKPVKDLLKSIRHIFDRKTYTYGTGTITFYRRNTSSAEDNIVLSPKGCLNNHSIEMPISQFFKLAPDDNEALDLVIDRIYFANCIPAPLQKKEMELVK